jgi:hypothetical protein
MQKKEGCSQAQQTPMVSCNLWHDRCCQAAAGFLSDDNAKQVQQSQVDIQSVSSGSGSSLQSYHLPLLLPLSALYTFSDIGTPPPMHLPTTITCLRFLNLTEILLNSIPILFAPVQPFPALVFSYTLRFSTVFMLLHTICTTSSHNICDILHHLH